MQIRSWMALVAGDLRSKGMSDDDVRSARTPLLRNQAILSDKR
jgi:hypothetical protein